VVPCSPVLHPRLVMKDFNIPWVSARGRLEGKIDCTTLLEGGERVSIAGGSGIATCPVLILK